MAEFIIIYHGGGNKPMTPEEGQAHRGKWMEWIKGLGDAVVNPGQPLKGNQILSSDGVADADGSDKVTGFAVVKANDLDAAMQIAKGDPFMNMGGTIEVAEMVNMGG